MSTDWREKEREFLTGLKADTGRDLAEWMRVIAAQNLPHRNDIIDWLRQQGFPFARASWLERVHHNAGRPIYCDPADLVAGAVEAEAAIEVQRIATGGGGRSYVVPAAADFTGVSSGLAAKAERKPAVPATPRLAAERISRSDDARPIDDTPIPAAMAPEVREASAPQPVTDPSGPAPASACQETVSEVTECGDLVPAQVAAADSVSLDEVLAKAKAYRPLAQHLLKVLGTAIPALERGAAAGHIGLAANGCVFGLVAISARDIRLALRLDMGAEWPGLGPVKLPVTLSRAAQGLTHMAILNDARQIDEALINLVRRAAGV